MTGGEYYRQAVEVVRNRGNYFKAVQPDGLSFMGSPKKLYAVGATTVAEGDDSVLCRKGVLHVSDVPSETLTGGEWPCRLFEVSGEIVAGFNSGHPHKGGAKSLYVVRELPAWMALGPNGRAAAAFIDLLLALDTAARDAARVASCLASWEAACVAAVAATREAARDGAVAAAGAAAAAATFAAVRAIIVADLITPEQFQGLYKPFADVLPIEHVRKRGVAMFPMEAK